MKQSALSRLCVFYTDYGKGSASCGRQAEEPHCPSISEDERPYRRVKQIEFPKAMIQFLQMTLSEGVAIPTSAAMSIERLSYSGTGPGHCRKSSYNIMPMSTLRGVEALTNDNSIESLPPGTPRYACTLM